MVGPAFQPVNPPNGLFVNGRRSKSAGAPWWCSPLGGGFSGEVTAMAWIRDRALTLVLMAMFLLFLVGQCLTGFFAEDPNAPWPVQSEFLAIALMVWLAVYIRQRWSPESKPVHAPHAETGR